MIEEVARLVAYVIITLLLIRFLPTYAGEKGKNLATKEDIAGITREVERTRLAFERVRHVSTKQVELELEVYRSMWDALIDLHRAAEQLRPAVDAWLGSEEAEKTRRAQRLDAVNVAFKKLSDVAYKHRPFYPAEVYTKVRNMIGAVHKEVVQFSRGDPRKDADYWDKQEANIAAINEHSEVVGDAIRARMEELSNADAAS